MSRLVGALALLGALFFGAVVYPMDKDAIWLVAAAAAAIGGGYLIRGGKAS